MVIAAVTLAAGPALAAFQYVFARAQVDVMPVAPGAVSSGFTSVLTVSTTLPVVALFVPLLIIGVLVYGAANTAVIRTQSRPPLFTIPGAAALARARSVLVAAAVPEQYRSIVNPRALEAAVAAGQPLFWLASLAALGFAVTR
jgi:hypothetical protein